MQKNILLITNKTKGIMKNALKIYKGYYLYEGYTITKTTDGWELRNECTGELNYKALTKKECIKEVDYILSWED